MKRDDYHVVVYQLLSYLYRSLKEGTSIQEDMIKHDGKLFQIHEKYWIYIMEMMIKQEFVSGISVRKVWGVNVAVENIEDVMITPAGIEYLCEDKMIKKAYDFAKDMLMMVPITL